LCPHYLLPVGPPSRPTQRYPKYSLPNPVSSVFRDVRGNSPRCSLSIFFFHYEEASLSWDPVLTLPILSGSFRVIVWLYYTPFRGARLGPSPFSPPLIFYPYSLLGFPLSFHFDLLLTPCPPHAACQSPPALFDHSLACFNGVLTLRISPSFFVLPDTKRFADCVRPLWGFFFFGSFFWPF